jgi:REP element-mobilizing transposase RayT
MPSSPKPGHHALRKGRFSQANGLYLLTTVTEQRIPWFQVLSFAQIMCQSLEDPNCLGGSKNLCWVVMPDHIHLLLQLGDAGLSEVAKKLKALSARRLNREIGRTGRFWAPGFHDHALRTGEDMKGVARYIVANPLRAGLVKRVADYPYWNAVWL